MRATSILTPDQFKRVLHRIGQGRAGTNDLFGLAYLLCTMLADTAYNEAARAWYGYLLRQHGLQSLPGPSERIGP